MSEAVERSLEQIRKRFILLMARQIDERMMQQPNAKHDQDLAELSAAIVACHPDEDL